MDQNPYESPQQTGYNPAAVPRPKITARVIMWMLVTVLVVLSAAALLFDWYVHTWVAIPP